METPSHNLARRFLATGRFPEGREIELTAACTRLILATSRKSFARALALSEKFVALAGKRDRGMQVMSLRVLGQMSHMVGRHDQALAAYTRARALAARDALARAGMDRMLTDVYMYLGRYVDARRAAMRAMRTYARADRTADWHKARVNYANLLHRVDRHLDAARIYRDAAEYFERAGDPLSAARCAYNLANSLVQLFDMDEADRHYARARDIYERAGYTVDACDVRYGQAWLRMLRGELHLALVELDQCARTYHQSGKTRGLAACELDLAEVSLGLGLYTDALDYARRAGRRYSRLNMRYEQAKASLFRGQASLALGLRREAARAAEQARLGFHNEGNTGFTGAVHLLLAALDESKGLPAARQMRAADRLFQKSQLPLWKAICDLKSAQSQNQIDRALANLSGNRAAQVVPHIFAGWQTIQGDRFYTLGKIEEARVCWTRAANRLDAVRSQLPPVELRGAYGRSLPSPHARLVASEATRSPRRAAVWSERYKTAGVWAPISPDALSPRRRRHITESLEALSSQVSCLMRQLPGQAGERGATTAQTSHSLQRLQRKLRLQFSELETALIGSVSSDREIDELITSTSRRLPIVQFHVADNDLFAFVHQHGRSRTCTIRDGRRRIVYAMERWRFLMERQVFSHLTKLAMADRTEEAFWSELGHWLWQPLQVDTAADRVLIVAEGELANLPWQALSDRGKRLVERHHFTLAPSIRHFAAAERVNPVSRTIRLFRNDDAGLPHIESEAALLRAMAGDSLIEHSPSRRADWPMDGESRLWHFAGHAVLSRENPFYSYLLQSDGPLFAADFRVRRCRVGLATLAACRTGEQVAVPGDESTGLVRSLLEMGARNVIAGRWPVSDESASQWMKTFYHRYLRNDELFAATREATLDAKDRYPSAYHWAAFAVFGAASIGGPNET